MTIVRLVTSTVAATLLGGCAGDLGAESAQTCNARPIDPPGYRSLATELVEGETRNGHRYAYVGPDGERVTFYYGVTTGAGGGLPNAGRLPLATIGAGRLSGQGSDWTFVWNEQLPCDRMRVVGTGIEKQAFVQLLSLTGVMPREEEEGEGEPGAVEQPGVEEELEELEGELEEGALPPGGPAVEWVAVFDSAPGPEELERLERRLLERAPHHIAISPVSCWKGLPRTLGVSRDSYVAAVVAVTANELDFTVERVGLEAVFFGQLRARCD